MNEKITTETKPRLFKLGQMLLVDSLVTDPSITIIETGKTMELLLSESCYSDEEGNFRLENVLWCRYKVPKSEIAIKQAFEKVEVYLHKTGVFIAQDILSNQFLPYPSIEPYWIILIEKEQYKEMYKLIEKRTFDKFSEMIIISIQGIPEFYILNNSIVGKFLNSFFFLQLSMRKLKEH